MSCYAHCFLINSLSLSLSLSLSPSLSLSGPPVMDKVS
jgi:hypothetical protein